MLISHGPRKKNNKTWVNLPGAVTRTTWQLPGDLGEDDWRECGLVLGKMQGAIQWWIGDWWAFGEARYGERKAIVEAEDWGGPSLQTCMDAGWVASKFTTSRRREVSFNHHREVAALEQADQDYWLDKAEADGLSVMMLRAAIRQGEAADRTEATELDANKLGKFAIILADPPWRYEHPPMGGTGRSVENHYPTMPLEEICALPIAEIANDDALLFLWATALRVHEGY